MNIWVWKNKTGLIVIRPVLIWHLMKNCMAVSVELHAPSWSEPGERVIFGPDLIVEAKEKVQLIQSNLRATLSWQKSYVDKRRQILEFEMGKSVHLHVLPTKGGIAVWCERQAWTRYIGPFIMAEKLLFGASTRVMLTRKSKGLILMGSMLTVDIDPFWPSTITQKVVHRKELC